VTELLVHGGRVLRPDLTVERADVLADRETGRIVDVGLDLTASPTERLDATDALVVPGLVNAHTHVSMTLLRGYADDKPLDSWLREDIWPVEAELQAGDVYAGARLGLVEMVKSGTTALSDMYFQMAEVCDAVAEVGVRARLGRGAVTVGLDDDEARQEVAETVRVAEALDGRADGRVRGAVCPHSLTTVDEARLEQAARGAREAGLPLHYHANETAEEVAPYEERGVRPLAWARENGLLEAGDLLAHCVHVDDEEVDLLAATGASALHCPASNAKLASGIAPVERLHDAGVRVALGTDGPASNNDLDLFDEVRDAAMMGKLKERDATAVPAEAAVEAATSAGADALGFDAGRIEAGRLADLAVVDLSAPHLVPEHDPVSHLAYAVRGSDVRHTVCDGRVLMRDREVLPVDEPRVVGEARERARALVARAE
jgi:5-methylthioadenosine/S-adenosylhomocysteine deaminase